jgi:hypothetical protein
MTIYKNKGSEFQQNKEKLNNLIPQKHTIDRPHTLKPDVSFLLASGSCFILSFGLQISYSEGL